MSDRNPKSKSIPTIKSGVFNRGSALTKLALGMGRRAAQYGLSQLSSEEERGRLTQRLLVEQAQVLAEQLGQLKGSVMKVGQMLSVYGEYFLPPEANSLLKSLQFSSPPLAWNEIEKILIEELGTEKMAELEIEDEPYAAASVGQVHLATLKRTGERVAIKVQYPDVDKAIETDLAFLKRIFSVVQLMPQIPHLDSIFEEVREMLLAEVDYRRELLYLNKFGDRLRDDKRYVVPRAFERFCTRKVIASSFETGFTLDSKAVQALPLARRNALAESILELYYRELYQWGEVQTDPHQGNYRVRLSEHGDQLILFDFGAAKTYSAPFLFHYRRLIRAAVAKDHVELETQARALGFFDNQTDPGLVQLFIEFCDLLAEPFSGPGPDTAIFFGPQGEYRWSATDVPRRLTAKLFELKAGYRLRTPPRELLFIDRKTGGMFILLSLLGAEWNPRPTYDRFADEKSWGRIDATTDGPGGS